MKHLFKRNTKNHRQSRMATFWRREDGATAIEFSILALPFFALLFGIIELAIVFFVGSNVKNATFEASRRIRTGEFIGGEPELETAICAQMNPGGTSAQMDTCRIRLSIKVKTLSDFSTATAFAPMPVIDPMAPVPPNYTASTGGDTVIVTATYRYPLAVPGELSRLSNVDGENSRDIKAITAFRNEPF
jgi:Flp pilus assembly protein TadG